jgi:hypothetical protein
MRAEMRFVQGDVTKTSVYAEAQAWARLFERKNIDRTLIGIMIMVFQRRCSQRLFELSSHRFAEWSGINALLYYGPTLVQSIGLRGDTVSLVVSGGIGIVQFIAVIPAIVYIDRWGEAAVQRISLP